MGGSLKIWRVFVVVIALVLALTLAACAASVPAEPMVEMTQEEFDALQTERDLLEKENARLLAELEALSEALAFEEYIADEDTYPEDEHEVEAKPASQEATLAPQEAPQVPQPQEAPAPQEAPQVLQETSAPQNGQAIEQERQAEGPPALVDSNGRINMANVVGRHFDEVRALFGDFERPEGNPRYGIAYGYRTYWLAPGVSTSDYYSTGIIQNIQVNFRYAGTSRFHLNGLDQNSTRFDVRAQLGPPEKVQDNGIPGWAYLYYRRPGGRNDVWTDYFMFEGDRIRWIGHHLTR